MKKLSLTLAILFVAAFAHAQVIEQYYHFNQPVITERDGYQQLGLEGCLPQGHVGEPTLPWQSVNLILPQGQEAVAMNVEFFDYVELEGNYRIYPYQKPRPYSNEETIPFAKDEKLYRSNNPYPTRNYGNVNTQYLNGVAFAFGGFTPIQYIPATGKVLMAQTVKVSIETTSSREDHNQKLWLTPDNEAAIKSLAQNDDMLDSYRHRGREISGYDMLVITSEEWIPSFGEYLDLYNAKGIRTRIVSLEEIYATMDGRDNQEMIRNYIIQEYENNGIMMVSLGGDVAIVPFRPLWCYAQEGDEDQLPADMYYACLDGTLNDDNDDRWGEVGEDDLLPELGIGRLSFNNETQFQNIMHKIFSYLQTPVLGEFTSPILGAEHLGDGYYGSTDMERLVGTNSDFGYTTHGYTPNYTIKRYYETHSKPWAGNEFKQLIGTGGQYVHHVGHANTGIVAGWDISNMDNNYFANNDGINHNYMLFHSHGCICGDFSHSCILERMVTIPCGFVVTTGNSRYGWYEPWGDGMAAHIHREFVNAYCYEHIPSVGMALRKAKIATAPWVTIDGENGYLRWNIYCLNVIGDAALCPWFEEPFTPDVVYETGLMTGTTSTTVNVNRYGTPLSNYSVSLFDGETLLARGITDANGNAELTFSPSLEVVGEMQLIVTGQSAWPQVLEVTGFASGEAYIYGDILSLDEPPLFGTHRFVIGDLYNKGDVTANNVHASITTDCEHVVCHDSNLTIDEFEPNSTQHFDNLGSIEIANNIPDQTVFTLYLTTSFDEVSHMTQKSFVAMAPNMQYESFVINDSQGDNNGYADPGERVVLLVNGKNNGHALASDTYLTVSCSDNQIQIEEQTVQIGDINPDGTFTAPVVFTSDFNITNGTVIHFDIVMHTGEYAFSYDYAFPVGLTMETFESGDFSYLEWNHSGEQYWSITDEEAHTGTYSARSGAIANNEISSLFVYVDIVLDGELSFYLKTSTQLRHDYLMLFIDNKMQTWWSGETDWTYASFDISAGSHVIEWRYDKSPTQIAGSDCVWIDDISLPRSTVITKVEETATTKPMALYPNPCNGSFSIEPEEESNIAVYNLLGQKVTELHHVSGRQQIQLEDAPKGLYLIQIQNESGMETKKLLVK